MLSNEHLALTVTALGMVGVQKETGSGRDFFIPILFFTFVVFRVATLLS